MHFSTLIIYIIADEKSSVKDFEAKNRHNIIMNTQNKQFAENIRSLLKENSLSIAELAVLTNIPRTTINSWLNQNCTPKIEYLTLLSKYFKRSIDYLLGVEDEFGNKKLY